MIDYERLKKDIYNKLGIDLHAYKEQQMRRRINQWLDRYSLGSYQELVKTLSADAGHRAKFTEYLTINTSNFFRDTAVFESIAAQVLPAIGRGPRPRIWSAGASIGAEIYSIAMLAAEQRLKAGLMLATDLDQVVLEKAKAGVYAANQVSGIAGEYLAKYFRKTGDGSWQLLPVIKDQVTFRQHNLLKDSYERDFDLILCRNVFIYFTSETQKRLIDNFVKSLKPQGYFIVGSAEQIMDPTSYGLKRISYCIYQKVV